MARPLRLELAGTWYHVMNRGHRGGNLFHNDEDRRRFLGSVAELPDRFGLEIHAFVLMDNHYHLLARTTQANLSHAVRWLNVSYAVKFNWAHRWHGTVFQGRYKAVVIEEDAGAVKVARYLHLNPVRIGGLGLGSSDYARRLLSGRKLDEREQTEARRMRRRVNWQEVVQAAEKLRGEKWEQWVERHGDWTRDAVLYVATRHGGMRLAEAVKQVSGMKYQAAAQAVKRFGQLMEQDPGRRRFVSQLKRQVSSI